MTRRSVLSGLAGLGGLTIGALGGTWYARREAEWEPLDEGDALTILTGRDETVGGQRTALVRQWNRLHPRHRAELRELPDNADLQYSGIHAALQAGDRDIDLVNLDLPWIAEFVEQEHLKALDELEDDRFLARPLQAGTIGGEVYALPFNTDVGLLYYNRDFTGDAPADWTDRRQFNQAMVSLIRGAGGFEGGIAMQLAPYEGFTVNVWEILLSRGAEPLREDLLEFDRDRTTIETLDEIQRQLDEDIILGESLQFKEADSLEAFKAGKTAFLRHWPSAHPQLLACDTVDFEVGVAPLPGTGVLGGQSLAVTAGSRYPTVAQALAEFLTSARSQQILFERGGFASTRPEPYEDAYAREAASDDPVPLSSGECRDLGTFPLEGVGAIESGLERAGLRPAVDRYIRFSEAFHGYLHPRFSSGQAIEPELLQRELKRAVEGR